MFAKQTNNDPDSAIGLLNEVCQNDSQTPSDPNENNDFQLKIFDMEEKEDGAAKGRRSLVSTEFNNFQTESDERELEQLDEVKRIKRMECNRKIGTVFSAIEMFKSGVRNRNNKSVRNLKYQPKWTFMHAVSANGLAEQLQELIDAGNDPNAVDDRGRTVLDVAGSAFYQGKKIQNLPYVLRTLLAAGGKFNTMKGDIDSVDTPLHTAVELNCLESVKILLDQGASVACLNSSGYTPLHLSILRKFEEVLETLLTYNCENAEAVVQRTDTRDISGFTLLQCAVLIEWREGVHCLLDEGADVTAPSNIKFEFYSHTHEPPLHLAAETGNRMILWKLLTSNRNAVNHFNHLGQTPLFIAIRSGHLDCVETLIAMGANVLKLSKDNQNILHVAIQFGFKDFIGLMRCLESEDLTTILNSFDSLGYAPIHTAVANNHVDCIELLALRNAFLRKKTNGEFVEDWTPLHIAAAKNYPEAANVILKYDKKAIDDEDHKGRTPIHLAASRCNREVMVEMLRHGAVLSSRIKRNNTTGCQKKKDVTALELISKELPNPTPFLEEVFDSFIDSYDPDLTKESGCLITMDYGVFTKVDGVSQIEVLEEFLKCDQRKILIHPLVESLIYIKWRSLLPLFCVIVSIYGLFSLSLYVIIIDVFYQESTDSFMKGWADALFLTPLIFIIIVEIIFITIHRARYFCQFENWIKMFSICFAIILMSSGEEDWKEEEWSRHLATVTLLLSWAQIMFLLSRFPYMGFYVLMFCKVSINILKIIITFVFLLIAFSLSFMIQYHSKPPFDGPWSAFIKTIVMMTSEFEYDDLFGSDHSEELANSKQFVHIIFVLFLIFVSIVFVNFMLGVAVSDVNELKIDGDIRRLEKQVEYLSTLDLLAYGTFMRRILKKDFIYKRYVKEISIKAGVTKHWEVIYEAELGYDDERNYTKKEISLPSHILDTIFQKIKTKKEQREEEKRTQLYRKQIDILFKTIVGDRLEKDILNDRRRKYERTEFEKVMDILYDLDSRSNEINEKFDRFRTKHHIADKSTQTYTPSFRKSM